MSIDEMKVFSETLGECVRLREDVSRCQQAYNCLLDQSQKAQKEFDTETEDNNRLREENANLHNQVTELTAERDDARRRLKETVMMLEDIWRDCSQKNWESKADKKRAKEMAEKIKAWGDAKEFHMVETDKGEWVVK